MPAKEMTFEEFSQLPFNYTMGMRFDTHAQRMYRNEEFGLQIETHTPFNEKTWEWGKEQRGYFMDHDDREFDTRDQLYVAYMEKVCGVKQS